MFGVILHPQPVGRRRAVPELIVPGVELDRIEPGHVLYVPNRGQSRLLATVLPAASSLEIVVKYHLSEYLRILLDFLPTAHRRAEEAKGNAKAAFVKHVPWHTKLLLYGVAVPAFFYKVRKVGTCRFGVDNQGIKRTSKHGALKVPWEEVAHVLPLSQAYLVEKLGGAMPIPYRCMSQAQRVHFERLAGAKLSLVERRGT